MKRSVRVGMVLPSLPTVIAQRRYHQQRAHHRLLAAERLRDRGRRLVARGAPFADGAVDVADGDLQQQHQEAGGQQAGEQAGAQALAGQADQDGGQGFVLHAAVPTAADVPGAGG